MGLAIVIKILNMIFVTSELLTEKNKIKTRQGEPYGRPQVEHSQQKSSEQQQQLMIDVV